MALHVLRVEVLHDGLQQLGDRLCRPAVRFQRERREDPQEGERGKQASGAAATAGRVVRHAPDAERIP